MFEVLLITESTGQNFNISAYNASNSQTLASFKGGTSLPHTLCLRNDEHIISSIPKKPVIQVYEISRKSQQSVKIALPGIIRSLKISNDGALLAAGINNNVLVWELAGGELLAILSRHYQNVTCLDFSHDDSYLAASGEDGIVSMWDLATVWDKENVGSVEPYHSWTSHTVSVSHLKFGLRYRVYSSSLDCSIKIHDVPTKQTIMTIVFDFGVSSFDFNTSETSLFVGCINGSLHSVSLMQCGHDFKNSINQVNGEVDNSERNVIKNAHTKSISCIACSLDCSFIVTGSDDSEVKFWNVSSLQCLKTMKLTGSVTNLLLAPSILGLTSASNKKPSMPFPKLHRQTVSSNEIDEADGKYFRIMENEDSNFNAF